MRSTGLYYVITYSTVNPLRNNFGRVRRTTGISSYKRNTIPSKAFAVHIKDNVVHVRAITADRGGGADVQFHSFLTSTPDGDEGSPSRTCKFTTGEITPVPLVNVLTPPGCPARSQSLYRLHYPGSLHPLSIS